MPIRKLAVVMMAGMLFAPVLDCYTPPHVHPHVSDEPKPETRTFAPFTYAARLIPLVSFNLKTDSSLNASCTCYFS